MNMNLNDGGTGAVKEAAPNDPAAFPLGMAQIGDKMKEQTIPVFYSEVPVHLLVDVANFLRGSYHSPERVNRRALDLAALLLKCTEKAAPGE